MNIVVTEPEYQKGKSVFSNTGDKIKCIPAPPEENRLAEKIALLGAKHAIVGICVCLRPVDLSRHFDARGL